MSNDVMCAEHLLTNAHKIQKYLKGNLLILKSIPYSLNISRIKIFMDCV